MSTPAHPISARVIRATSDITQGPGVVALRTEMIHDARILPIGGGPHISSAIRQYHGDSRAHWDGDTLVVDTINFSNAGFRGSTDSCT